MTVLETVRFTGKERDGETGLDYFGARYLSAGMGRFTSPDPMLNSAKPWDPKSWNRYSYALNNPLKFVDPNGLDNLVNTCAEDNKKCNKQFEQNAVNLKQGLADLQRRVDKMKNGAGVVGVVRGLSGQPSMRRLFLSTKKAEQTSSILLLRLHSSHPHGVWRRSRPRVFTRAVRVALTGAGLRAI